VHGNSSGGEATSTGIRKWLLDEIPAAYKDIDEVMEHARDLVK